MMAFVAGTEPKATVRPRSMTWRRHPGPIHRNPARCDARPRHAAGGHAPLPAASVPAPYSGQPAATIRPRSRPAVTLPSIATVPPRRHPGPQCRTDDRLANALGPPSARQVDCLAHGIHARPSARRATGNSGRSGRGTPAGANRLSDGAPFRAPSRSSFKHGTSSDIGTRTCSIESRSRMVTCRLRARPCPNRRRSARLR